MIGAICEMTENREFVQQWIRNMKDDPNPTVRSSATYTLRKYDDPDIVPALIDALKDSDMCVRKNAAKALGYKKAAEAIPALKVLFDNRDPYVIRAGKEAVKKIENQTC